MRRLVPLVIAVTLFAPTLFASDPRTLSQYRSALDNLTKMSTSLAEQTQRDAEILRKLRAAARSLDDWQKTVAVQNALDHISKAQQLAARSSKRVQQAVMAANEVMAPAKQSPGSADLSRLRGELHARPIEQMRMVVGEEMDVLARISTQVADIASLLTKAVADASSATLGGGD